MAKQYVDIVWNPQRWSSKAGEPGDGGEKSHIDYSVPAPVRGINMLLAKYRAEAYSSEVPIRPHAESCVPVLPKALAEAKIAFVTDGGLVPRGNPDQLQPVNSEKFCIYSFQGQKRLHAEQYEVCHQGYDNQYILEDPNRLVPLDAAKAAEAEGRIRKVFDLFYSTTGVMTSVENSRGFGRRIATSIRESDVDGVILTSTCGTSTRCGAYIACEIEKAGIPVVHVTNLTSISEWVGCSRILWGNHISYVFGAPELSYEQELGYRQRQFDKALELLAARPEGNACLVVR